MGKRKHKSVGGCIVSPRIGQLFPLEISPSLVSKQSEAGLRRRMTGCNRRSSEDDYRPRHLLIQTGLIVITDTNHFPLCLFNSSSAQIFFLCHYVYLLISAEVTYMGWLWFESAGFQKQIKSSRLT